MNKSLPHKEDDFTNISILIVEDDFISMMILTKMLEIKNATVSKASNGDEAVQLLNAGQLIDLVILDLEMPVMNGYIAIEKIKKQFPVLPVLAFTASILDAPMLAALKQKGFADVIPKFCKPDLFYAKIFRALKKEAV